MEGKQLEGFISHFGTKSTGKTHTYRMQSALALDPFYGNTHERAPMDSSSVPPVPQWGLPKDQKEIDVANASKCILHQLLRASLLRCHVLGVLITSSPSEECVHVTDTGSNGLRALTA